MKGGRGTPQYRKYTQPTHKISKSDAKHLAKQANCHPLVSNPVKSGTPPNLSSCGQPITATKRALADHSVRIIKPYWWDC